jgi:DNA polymerase
MDQNELRQKVLKCPQCPWKDRKTQTVPFEGPNDAEVMIIGRNPGEQEDLHGRPFYDRAPGGSRFNDFLRWVGLPRERVWVTNLAKCQGKTPTERDPAPTPEVYQTCHPWIKEEMKFLQPTLKIVVTLGNDVMHYVTSQEGSSLHQEGTVIKLQSDGPIFFIMTHPGWWLRQRRHLSVIQNFVAPKLRRLLIDLGVKGLVDPNERDLFEILKSP